MLWVGRLYRKLPWLTSVSGGRVEVKRRSTTCTRKSRRWVILLVWTQRRPPDGYDESLRTPFISWMQHTVTEQKYRGTVSLTTQRDSNNSTNVSDICIVS